jgi:uncharacterized protein RhaS with RHS repeats
MYDPSTGRWLSVDPIGFEAGDANLYRYVRNEPLLQTDPTGLFEYRPVSPPRFGGEGDPIGYSKLRLDIAYPKVGAGGRPARGSFVQVSTVTTIVVTCDKNNTLKASPPKVTYIADQDKLVAGKNAYPEGLSGPDFDKKLAADAVLVISYVKKEHGFTTAIVGNVSGSDPITEEKAQGYRRSFDNKYEKGTYEYYYVWINSEKCKGVKNLEKALPEAIDKKYREAFEAAMKQAAIDPTKFNGQFVIGGSGLDYRADLKGEPIKK